MCIYMRYVSIAQGHPSLGSRDEEEVDEAGFDLLEAEALLQPSCYPTELALKFQNSPRY